MMDNKILPIGTVCKLLNGKRRVMITGHFVKSNNDNSKVFDYCGCGFPEGVISPKLNLVFDNNQIESIEKIGYEDEESTKFCEKLYQAKLQIIDHNNKESSNG